MLMVAKIVNLKKNMDIVLKPEASSFGFKKKQNLEKDDFSGGGGRGGKYVVLIGVEIWPKTGIMKPRKIWGTASYSLIEIY